MNAPRVKASDYIQFLIASPHEHPPWFRSRLGRRGVPHPPLPLRPDGVRAQRAALARALPDVDVRYAVKANSNLAVCAALARAGLGAEICSDGELALALAAGFPADAIVLGGPRRPRRPMPRPWKRARAHPPLLAPPDEPAGAAGVAPDGELRGELRRDPVRRGRAGPLPAAAPRGARHRPRRRSPWPAPTCSCSTTSAGIWWCATR